MSRRAVRKRKEDAVPIAQDDHDDHKDDKRSRVQPAAAASSSSSAAAGALPSRLSKLAPSAAASSSPPSAASVAPSPRLPVGIEELLCSACLEPFECEDGAARLPRLLPCGRHQLCSACIVNSIAINPGSVRCPHGLLAISTAGIAAAALSTAEDWMRLLPPFADFIVAIRNQQLMMTRLGQQGAECSHQGCKAAVTHYCPDCGDLCSAHERKRHALLFPSHTASTVPIAQKAAARQSKLAGPAATIRAQMATTVQQRQWQLSTYQDELWKLKMRVAHKEQQIRTTAQALETLKPLAERMQAADDSAVLEMEAERLEAGGQAYRPLIDSTVLSALPDDRVADLQTFLGPDRSLSDAQLIYRASRDGFEAKDWWRMCGGKSNLLTIVRVQRNNFIFGAFTAFQWPARAPAKERSFTDPTGTTFLFSLVNARGRAVKLRLKESVKVAGKARPGDGPMFGNGDVGLMAYGQSAHLSNANLTEPKFDFDSVSDEGASISYGGNLLAGLSLKSFYYFAGAEIESLQL